MAVGARCAPPALAAAFAFQVSRAQGPQQVWATAGAAALLGLALWAAASAKGAAAGRAALCLALAGASAAGFGSEAGPATTTLAGGGAEAPPVILITIDTLRADALHCCGEASAAPAIASLARDAISFEQARSSAPWTVPAMAALLSGVSPWVTGSGPPGLIPAPEVPLLSDRLREAGYRTAAIGRNFLLSPWGSKERFASGFDEVDFFPLSPRPETAALRRLREGAPELLRLEATSPDLADKAVAWLDGAGPEPFFLWLHFFDPHAPYAPPAEDLPDGGAASPVGRAVEQPYLDAIREGEAEASPETIAAIRALYQAEFRATDREVGRVLDRLRELGIYDRALIALTSDHGEEFYEHGGMVHGWTLHEEMLRVPLLIKPPGRPDGRRVEAVVGTIDLPPTLLELAGISFDANEMQGRSLACSWAAEPCALEPRPELATSLIGRRSMRSALVDGLKLIEEPAWGRSRLYDLAADPGERHDIAAQRPDAVAAGRAALEAHVAHSEALRKRWGIAGKAEAGYGRQDRDKLRSLGYIQ
ncbi:MAG: sulfatase-like hydrolase/transferase [Acidobacteria bacterium]|nr:sulfatase-like hydrolase/transferase [Acidobacteriota bacterium]